MMRAVDALNTLADADPDADSYNYKKVSIPATMLRLIVIISIKNYDQYSG